MQWEPNTGTRVESSDIGNECQQRVDKFCYLGNVIGARGGAAATSIVRVWGGWKKFRELILPIKGCFTARKLTTCVRCDTWAVEEAADKRLDCADKCVVKWILWMSNAGFGWEKVRGGFLTNMG